MKHPRLSFKIETLSNLNFSTTSTQGNYGEFISSRRTSYKMQEEIMSKENGKYVHKSKETLNI